MDKQQTATIIVTFDEIQILNDVLTNSKPKSFTFGEVSRFITSVNTQLQKQIEDAKKEAEGPVTMQKVPDSAPTDSEGVE